ncbi:MAG: hypothetical protein N2645_03185 [Clostridia bacterium]|nr:hypothetical protein [Clostridia bacterium]
MDMKNYPEDLQKFILELKKRNTFNDDNLKDKTLMNYLHSQKFDEDYLKSMKNDR